MSNVSRLVQALDLAHRDEQLVFYDQGIGTNPGLVEDVKQFKSAAGKNRTGLEILDPPKVRLAWPLAVALGGAVGYGLYANLREMYQALALHYEPDRDRLFLFGFSRGAFTVRALAGLIHRCGIPARRFADDDRAFETCFAQAYAAYRPHHEEGARADIDAFKQTYQPVKARIHFLGIWDTVKSYGGLWPRSLPHLRFNPSVDTVRHALALDERRSWFQATSWGGVDSVKGEASLVPPGQQISEVWFKGCHSDIGGGCDLAKIALRWMLGEATEAGLLLDPGCDEWIFASDEREAPLRLNESYHLGWWLSDLIPRVELDNRWRPPRRVPTWPGRGKRAVTKFARAEKVFVHVTSGYERRPDAPVQVKAMIETVETKPRLTRERV